MTERRGSDIVDMLVLAVGEDAALRLRKRFGGTELYIPKKIGESHPIAVAIGVDLAQKLAEYVPVGEKVMIPKYPRRHQLVSLLKREGHLSNKAIATETDYSERHIYRLLNPESDDRQPDLFAS